MRRLNKIPVTPQALVPHFSEAAHNAFHPQGAAQNRLCKKPEKLIPFASIEEFSVFFIVVLSLDTFANIDDCVHLPS